jgi:hypothetical protein
MNFLVGVDQRRKTDVMVLDDSCASGSFPPSSTADYLGIGLGITSYAGFTWFMQRI